MAFQGQIFSCREFAGSPFLLCSSQDLVLSKNQVNLPSAYFFFFLNFLWEAISRNINRTLFHVGVRMLFPLDCILGDRLNQSNYLVGLGGEGIVYFVNFKLFYTESGV